MVTALDAILISSVVCLASFLIGLTIKPTKKTDIGELAEEIRFLRKETKAQVDIALLQIGFISSLQKHNGELQHMVSVIQADRGGLLAKNIILQEQVVRLTDSLKALQEISHEQPSK